MGFKKYPPIQDSIFRVLQGAFGMIGPVPSDQLKIGDVVRPKSMLYTVVTSLSQDEENRQVLEEQKGR